MGAALGLLSSAAAAQAAAQPSAFLSAQTLQDFDIAAGPLDRAIVVFSQQAGVQLVVDARTGREIVAKPVRGRMTQGEALAQLLNGTGVIWRDLGNGTITLERATAPVRVIGAVQVEGRLEAEPFGPGAGDNGSSDRTATEGTESLATRWVTTISRGQPTAVWDAPQAVSVLTRERLDQQGVSDLAGALSAIPGVTVVVGTAGRISAQSRGFDVKAIKIDGGAAGSYPELVDFDPFGGVNLAAYDSVQVLRGSDGLQVGANDPGGVINLVRKRPLDQPQFSALAEWGSWTNRHVQVDATGPLAAQGRARARLVADYQKRDFFYETARRANALIYGVAEVDVDSDTLFRAGASYVRRIGHGENRYGLPRASDGADLALPRGLNLAPAWSVSDLMQSEVFGAVEHRLGRGWRLAANYDYVRKNAPVLMSSVETIVVPGAPALGVQVAAYQINLPLTQNTADLTLLGDVSAFGRKGTIIFGVDASDSRTKGQSKVQLLQQTFEIADFEPAELGASAPAFDSPTVVETSIRRFQRAMFVRAEFAIRERLTLAAGTRLTSYTYRSVSRSAPAGGPEAVVRIARAYRAVPTPGVSLTYALADDLNLHVSYAEIFGSNVEYGAVSGQAIKPSSGRTLEAGFKGALWDGKANFALTAYDTRQIHVAVADPSLVNDVIPGCCYIGDGARTSRGVDLEFSGQIAPAWQVQASYGYNDNALGAAYRRDTLGEGPLSSQQPKHSAKLWATFSPLKAKLRGWDLSGGLRFESARGARGLVCAVVHVDLGPCPGLLQPVTTRQASHAVVDLRVAYRITEKLEVSVLTTNLADKRYYVTAGQTTQANFYGEPRALLISLRARY
ncbi:TonB-dependent siderophore receptor [Caulobacter radicis]|uniref:TonB-dependent siderophore receptor n=1 Tax=Caulobacter radicis TaxID=2172650 RepID=UPI001403FEE0|nr:TonB-dependent receptor [Caulobacter radicis]